MNRDQAYDLVRRTFTEAFDRSRFVNFTREILNHLDEGKAGSWNGGSIKDAFRSHVQRYERVGTYTSPDAEKLDVLVVHLTNDSKLERARTAIRNFVADHLKARGERDAALVAFVSPSETQWRFSYVKMEYATVESASGKIGVETRLTPARRFSYIVGEGESCHTAQSRFLSLLQSTDTDPTLADIESAFSVEAVTKEFFAKYAALFADINAALENLAAKDRAIRSDFKAKAVNTVDFAKKLMGQIVFLCFLQKKGWLGVAKGQDWGTGPRDFLRRLARREYGGYSNFFNDVLEPLFYDTLAADRGHFAWSSRFQCRIPFLNGGLFEPLGDYDWRTTDVLLPDRLFTNDEPVEQGIRGSGVLDVFDRYNFTVSEAEPLEKEVAIDPEMLGKVFENLIEDNLRKGLGAYYTPREIVHYMCQQSLINYLDTAVNTREVSLKPVKAMQVRLFGAQPPEQVPLKAEEYKELVPRADIETFVHLGEQISHYEAVEASYRIKMPKSIEQRARLLDEKLAAITVCDPAVGSGAFPVGMMTEIVRARTALTPYFNDARERTAYHFKRHAIQNCLYGVDVDPGAVEIAKLRLWLSLVVDEEETKQVKPLPNLDFKIVAGDSLLGFPFKSRRLHEIERLKAQFFEETDHELKAQLKLEIDRRLAECFASSKKSLGYEVSFDFRVYFSEVFDAHGGFDVVIANPPYISAVEFAAKYPGSYRRLLNESFEAARGTYDLYILFMERGLQLLAHRGVLVFINPNKYLAARYAVALRQYVLAHAALVTLLDVSSIAVFAQQAVYPVVSVILKQPDAAETVAVLLPRRRGAQAFDRRAFAESSVPAELLRALPENIWGFLLTPNVDLLRKLIDGAVTLADVASINASSTAAEAAEYGEYIQPRQAKDALKLVNTGTIDRFVSLWGVEPLTHAGERYLTPYLPLGRAGVTDRRRLLYRSPKLIFAKMAGRCEALFDRDGEYASLNTNCLYDMKDGTSLAFMAGYCNSKVFMFLYTQFFGALRMSGGYYQFQAPQLRVMPFKRPSPTVEAAVSRAVGEILGARMRDIGTDVGPLDQEIDRAVYELYGLSREEIAVVEGASPVKNVIDDEQSAVQSPEPPDIGVSRK